MLLLLGGWKYPTMRLELGSTGEFLAFKYPVAKDTEFARDLDSVDLYNIRADSAN